MRTITVTRQPLPTNPLMDDDEGEDVSSPLRDETVSFLVDETGAALAACTLRARTGTIDLWWVDKRDGADGPATAWLLSQPMQKENSQLLEGDAGLAAFVSNLWGNSLVAGETRSEEDGAMRASLNTARLSTLRRQTPPPWAGDEAKRLAFNRHLRRDEDPEITDPKDGEEINQFLDRLSKRLGEYFGQFRSSMPHTVRRGDPMLVAAVTEVK